MGYACPVCGDPQADAVHLANHLAFTALARGGDHEEWLDESIPDWETLGEETLGERAIEHAEDADYPQVFEDTTDQAGHDHDHNHDHNQDHDYDHNQDHRRGRVGGDTTDPLVDDARSRAADATPPEDAGDVYEEARELTRQRRAGASGESDEEADETTDEATADDAEAGDDSETE